MTAYLSTRKAHVSCALHMAGSCPEALALKYQAPKCAHHVLHQHGFKIVLHLACRDKLTQMLVPLHIMI